MMNDRIGQHLGNYRLNSLIGKGGFGEVYLAEHIHLGTYAAIKLLDIQLDSAEAENFSREARVIARLIHPNIIRVLDYGVGNLTPFLVMDYAPNGTLRQRHPRGERVSLALVRTYVKQIAQALQFAHDMKIIHRDVKPQNMLIGQNDEILLSDFGIAVIGSSSTSLTAQNMAGTPIYMAPEQINGHISRASDQYALGIVVYEWLSGFPPFQGSIMEILTQHMYATLTPLRAKVPSIPPIIEEVVLKALAKDTNQRFFSIQEFAEAFEQAVVEAEISEETLKFVRLPVETPSEKDSDLSGGTGYGFGTPAPHEDSIVADPYSTTPGAPAVPPPYPWTPDPWGTPVPQQDPWGISAAPQKSPPKWEISEEEISTVAGKTSAPYLYIPDTASTYAFQGSELPESELQDSFILYHRADRQWAEWIAWQLRNEHYSIILPVWGVLPSTDIELELRKAAAKAKHTIILLSPNFFRTFASKPDWIDPLKQDSVSQQNRLIAIYIRDYRGKHKQHLESIHYLDLSRDEEAAARKILLEAMLGEYIVPDVAPVYPGRPRRRPAQAKTVTSENTSTQVEPIEQQEAQGPPSPLLSEADVTRRAMTFMQEIEMALELEDWPAVIHKIELLDKQSPHLLSDRLYYILGKAFLEEGEEESARKALNYGLALTSNQQRRLTLLRDCAKLMTTHNLWHDVLRYSNEALRLVPNDLDWLVIRDKAQKQFKVSRVDDGTIPTPPPSSSKELKSIEIFFSYSHKDKKYRTELENYLSHLKRISTTRSWHIVAWHDGEIGAGREFAQEINKHLSEAQIILLLISQEFIASEYCYDIEMQKALERHEAGEARVIPILLRSANWQGTPIDKLQVLPTDAKPVTKWSRREDAFMDIARGIQKEVEKLVGNLN